MRILFAGTPQFAADHLAYLLEQIEKNTIDAQLIGVYTQPDRKAGRGKKLLPSAVKKIAVEHKIPVYQPKSLKDEQALTELKGLEADIMIVAAYGLILPEPVLLAPRLGCINIHASLLPKWRGAAPIERSIIAGDRSTGITIMQMDEGLDTGDMILKSSCTIDSHETGDSLRAKLTALGRPLLLEALQLLKAGQQQLEKQNDNDSCYAVKLDKREGEINWCESASLIERKIRAFTSAMSAYTVLDGERIRITSATSIEANSPAAPPGTITDVHKDQILVVCGNNDGVVNKPGGSLSQTTLAIEALQLPGKKPLSVKELLNGKPDLFSKGDQFNLPATLESVC